MFFCLNKVEGLGLFFDRAVTVLCSFSTSCRFLCGTLKRPTPKWNKRIGCRKLVVNLTHPWRCEPPSSLSYFNSCWFLGITIVHPSPSPLQINIIHSIIQNHPTPQNPPTAKMVTSFGNKAPSCFYLEICWPVWETGWLFIIGDRISIYEKYDCIRRLNVWEWGAILSEPHPTDEMTMSQNGSEVSICVTSEIVNEIFFFTEIKYKVIFNLQSTN